MFDAAVDSAVVVSSAHVNNFICIITGPPNGPVFFCCLAYVVVCNTAGGRAGRAGGRHSTAGQSCYVPLGRHLGVLYVTSPSLMSLLCIAVNAYSHSRSHCIALVSYLSRVSSETHVTVYYEYSLSVMSLFVLSVAFYNGFCSSVSPLLPISVAARSQVTLYNIMCPI